MNRSILIVICDFLLVSLLAFSTVDIDKVSNPDAERAMKIELTTNQVDTGKDLAAAMKTALDEERKGRDQLQGELSRLRDTTSRQQASLSERDQQIQSVQVQLHAKEAEAQKLQQQQSSLQQQYTAAQANAQNLSQQLQNSATDALVSKEKLSALEMEMHNQAQQAVALQKQLDLLAKSNQAAQAEKQQLSTQLQVTQAEKRAAAEQAARMQDEVKIERAEKAKLAENVNVLASKSSELAQEVRENRPLAPNTIFSELSANRVQAGFTASRTGLLGQDAKHKDTQTVLVTDGTNIFALCHVQDTPLTLWSPGTDWEGLAGTLLGNAMATVPIHSLSFHLQDPRVVLIPVSAAEARQLGCKVYHISADPYKFQDAVLVGARDGYYGECGFQIDLTTPEYVKLDRSLLKGLFGKFNPSNGDLVFGRTGEFLGVMVNSTYCLRIHNFDAAATFQFGQNVRGQHTGQVLSQLYTAVFQMPFKLQ